MVQDRSAAALLREVGLLADGPVVWGRALPPTGAGVFLVELATPQAAAPLELTRVGKWLERVPNLRLDGDRPTSRALAARLSAFWLPSQPVLYIGASESSVSRRVAAITGTVLGQRRPAAGGHWLHALALPTGTRVWWTATTAVEEYEDALLAAFAAGVPEAERSALPDTEVVLPFANLTRSAGERKRTGLTGSLLAEPTEPPPPPTRIVQVPDGDADGANGEPAAPKRRATAGKSGSRSTAGAAGSPGAAGSTAAAGTPLAGPPPDLESLTSDGAIRMRKELDELVRVRRPEVIARIRAAKELGDLKENADYSSAREEQSFLEGRIQALEARLRMAVIVEAPAAGARIGLGSMVTIDAEGEQQVLTIVGSSESDPTTGRISSASPVGRALLGREAGDEVVIVTPGGDTHYRVVSVD
jgi:transcription elongation factor GreA